MKLMLCYVMLLFTGLLTGCGQAVQTENVLLPYPPVVVWDNKSYVFTDVIVPEEKLGDRIGEVKRYVDPTKYLPKNDEDSTLAKVGSGLFQIQGSDIKNEFAVEMNGQYVKVQHYEP